MAGRNQRNNADYFSHDADASSDEKIVYLESKFGLKGYAVYFKFLECMTRAEGFKLEWTEIKKAVYASKFGISVTEIEQIVTECCRNEIKAFVLEDGYLFSPGLLKRFEPLLQKREYNRQKYQEQKQEDKKPGTEKPISVTEKTQSKVKKRKEYNTSSELQSNSEQEPTILEIPLIKKDGLFQIVQSDIDQWQDTYPGVDVMLALKDIRQWNLDNPAKRKTIGGIRKHISTWLSRAQNQGKYKRQTKSEERVYCPEIPK
jgi:hypothetical protein